MKNEFLNKWIFKIALFSGIGLIFWLLTPNGGIAMYYILIFGGAFWFLYEYRINSSLAKNAFTLGLFLMIFDWIVENLGAMVNLWQSTNSFFFVVAVPIEIMLLATVGGAAWALHFPKKMDKIYILGDSLIFASFGMIGEMLLIANNQMVYGTGWTSLHAFIGYFFAFIILSFIWYKVVLKNR